MESSKTKMKKKNWNSENKNKYKGFHRALIMVPQFEGGGKNAKKIQKEKRSSHIWILISGEVNPEEWATAF